MLTSPPLLFLSDLKNLCAINVTNLRLTKIQHKRYIFSVKNTDFKS
jgi:hypothetical protein